jgi:hypothetical protein
MGELPQSLEIIFEVQMKRTNEKIERRKRSFTTYKMHFLFPLFSKLITFLFLVHFKRFKGAIEATPSILQIIFEL